MMYWLLCDHNFETNCGKHYINKNHHNWYFHNFKQWFFLIKPDKFLAYFRTSHKCRTIFIYWLINRYRWILLVLNLIIFIFAIIENNGAVAFLILSFFTSKFELFSVKSGLSDKSITVILDQARSSLLISIGNAIDSNAIPTQMSYTTIHNVPYWLMYFKSNEISIMSKMLISPIANPRYLLNPNELQLLGYKTYVTYINGDTDCSKTKSIDEISSGSSDCVMLSSGWH